MLFSLGMSSPSYPPILLTRTRPGHPERGNTLSNQADHSCDHHHDRLSPGRLPSARLLLGNARRIFPTPKSAPDKH